MTGDELADAWEAGTVLPAGVSHLQRLRIAWVLHRRHGAEVAQVRLLQGTRQACEVHGCPEKFDTALTQAWPEAIGEAIRRDGLGATAQAFIAEHPDLRRGRLLGKPGSAAHGG